jgi:modulator of FtsH protease
METRTNAVISNVLPEEVSKVLRNTYALLAMTVLFSAITAGVAMALNVPFMGLWTLLPYFLFLYMTEKNKNNASGLIWVFALTGWLGFSIGPIVSYYLQTSGSEPVLLALGGTALIFFACSAYVLTTRKNLGFMSGFRHCQRVPANPGYGAGHLLHVPGTVFRHADVADQ